MTFKGTFLSIFNFTALPPMRQSKVFPTVGTDVDGDGHKTVAVSFFTSMFFGVSRTFEAVFGCLQFQCYCNLI
jgi:hypothetical protein